MTKIASVAEVQQAGVTIEAEEAVAIAQELIAVLQRRSAEPVERPYGPPTPATVYLSDEGSIVCRGCDTTPAVSEIAILLQAMLPQATPAPGGLRYLIARALLDVDVPPFDSLADFAETLARYERGPRDQIIRRVLQRVDTRRALVPLSAADRRRHPRTSELRRALREADARLYLQKVATDAVAVTVTSRRSRPRHTRAAVACVGVGLLLIAAGEFVDSREGASAPPIAAVAPPPAPAPSAPSFAVRDVLVAEAGNASGAASERQTAPTASNGERRTPNADVRSPENRLRAGTRRSSPAARARTPREANRKSAASRTMLERLRLNWLRNVLTSL